MRVTNDVKAIDDLVNFEAFCLKVYIDQNYS